MYNLTEDLGLSVVKRTARKSTSRICGFIVYGKEHANVRKVINDQDYWDEFDTISGPNWPIFTFKPLEPKIIKRELPPSNPGVMQMMYRIEHTVEPRTNTKILEFLGLDDSSSTPCFVLFTWDDENHLISTAYKLNFSTVDEVHNELRGLIETVSKAETQIRPEYKRNIETYIQARDSVNAYLAGRQFRRIVLPGGKILFDMLENHTQNF